MNPNATCIIRGLSGSRMNAANADHLPKQVAPSLADLYESATEDELQQADIDYLALHRADPHRERAQRSMVEAQINSGVV